MNRDCPKDNVMVTKKILVLRTFGDSRLILKLTKRNKKIVHDGLVSGVKFSEGCNA